MLVSKLKRTLSPEWNVVEESTSTSLPSFCCTMAYFKPALSSLLKSAFAVGAGFAAAVAAASLFRAAGVEPGWVGAPPRPPEAVAAAPAAVDVFAASLSAAGPGCTGDPFAPVPRAVVPAPAEPAGVPAFAGGTDSTAAEFPEDAPAAGVAP